MCNLYGFEGSSGNRPRPKAPFLRQRFSAIPPRARNSASMSSHLLIAFRTNRAERRRLNKMSLGESSGSSPTGDATAFSGLRMYYERETSQRPHRFDGAPAAPSARKVHRILHAFARRFAKIREVDRAAKTFGSGRKRGAALALHGSPNRSRA